MKRKKNLALAASIIEIVVSGIFLIAFIGNFIIGILGREFEGISAEYVACAVLCFVFSILFIIDGILSLRVSRTNGESFAKSLKSLLVIGIVMLSLNLVVVIVTSALFYSADEVFGVTFGLIIATGVLKIVAATIPAKNEGKIVPTQTAPVEEKTEVVKTGDLIEKLDKANELYKNGLISEEEFSSLKDKIMKNN